MYDAFSVRGKKLEPERDCTVCTCGERSKRFIEGMMNLAEVYRSRSVRVDTGRSLNDFRK